MPDLKISELPALTSILPTDLILIQEPSGERPKTIAIKDCYFGVQPVGCVFRFAESSPGSGINTAILLAENIAGQHMPHGVASISVETDHVRVNFDKTYAYIGAVAAGGDDLLGGLNWGTRTFADHAKIYIFSGSTPLNPQSHAALRGTNNAVWVTGFMHAA